MNGNITKDGITADLEWMKRVGIGGMQNFDAALLTPVVVEKRLVFMTPEWKDAFRHAAALADTLGLEMAIAARSTAMSRSWPSRATLPTWRWRPSIPHLPSAESQWTRRFSSTATSTRPFRFRARLRDSPPRSTSTSARLARSTPCPLASATPATSWRSSCPRPTTGRSCRRATTASGSVRWFPADAKPGDTIHLVAQVTDSGKPPLTRYARVIVTVKAATKTGGVR